MVMVAAASKPGCQAFTPSWVGQGEKPVWGLQICVRRYVYTLSLSLSLSLSLFLFLSLSLSTNQSAAVVQVWTGGRHGSQGEARRQVYGHMHGCSVFTLLVWIE